MTVPRKVYIGEDVHFVDGSNACRPAKVIELTPTDEQGGQTATLTVFGPTGVETRRLVARDELPPARKILPGERSYYQGGTWHVQVGGICGQ